MATCEAIVPRLVAGGADLIEIGVPFSDPLADGTTIQRTSQAALDNGTRLVDCIELVGRLRREHGVAVPLILMGYYNPFLRYGLDRCVADCATAGVDGFIVPDLPAEESADLVAACREHGRDLIFLVAPTSTEARLRQVAERASGFVYCVSLTGVTGARDHLSDDLSAYIGRVRAATDLPLAIGFGISTAEHVYQVGRVADGAIVASALINHLDHYPKEEQPAQAEVFVRGLRSGQALPAPDLAPTTSGVAQPTEVTGVTRR
jgi:tryptophan synthase alpha chain